MENHDTLFNQIKTAAENAEAKDFPSMDKVWNRVEEKLETKVLTNKSNSWKKLAVAASIIALISIGYQFFKPEEKIMLPQNQVVIQEKESESTPEGNAMVMTDSIGIINKKEREKILQNQISGNGTTVVLQQPIKSEEIIIQNYFYSISEKDKEVSRLDWFQNEESNTNSDDNLKGYLFNTTGVHHIIQSSKSADSTQAGRKNPPLIVIDGKAVTNNGKSKETMLAEMDGEEIETIYLTEPLYIIDGIHYSEEELFGPNPTSPYAPLDKQEIKTVKILQEKNEIAPYGKKGEKGVVIITTKDGKPLVKKAIK
ncbi:hypothetical protein [Flavobacterium sp.]|uniref:hypothetical protein n=1 Tax=Flavobacterium sp. TaxID=239 RepID=UPI003D6C1B87